MKKVKKKGGGEQTFLLLVGLDWADMWGAWREKDAEKTVKGHIRLLHEFNEMRDVGQGLIGFSLSHQVS